MTVTLQVPWTVERFLAWEDKQEGRHEFDGIRIIEMTGGSRAHQRIVFNLLRFLAEVLDPDQFDPVQEMRINMVGKIRYPDVTVCAGRIDDQVKTLRDALVTFEVLSDDTAETDQNQKRLDYANIPSLRHYIILDQTRIAVTVLERAASGWSETTLTRGAISLPELGIEVPLEVLYRGLKINRQDDLG